jgi:S-adenosylmethionine decarboxylase
MYGIDSVLLNDELFLKEHLTIGIEASGAHICGWQIKKFEPEGVTLLALLSESHVSLHTYPSFQALFFDAFTCGDRCVPENIAKQLSSVLKPTHQVSKKIMRGQKI